MPPKFAQPPAVGGSKGAANPKASSTTSPAGVPLPIPFGLTTAAAAASSTTFPAAGSLQNQFGLSMAAAAAVAQAAAARPGLAIRHGKQDDPMEGDSDLPILLARTPPSSDDEDGDVPDLGLDATGKMRPVPLPPAIGMPRTLGQVAQHFVQGVRPGEVGGQPVFSLPKGGKLWRLITAEVGGRQDVRLNVVAAFALLQLVKTDAPSFESPDYSCTLKDVAFLSSLKYGYLGDLTGATQADCVEEFLQEIEAAQPYSSMDSKWSVPRHLLIAGVLRAFRACVYRTSARVEQRLSRADHQQHLEHLMAVVQASQGRTALPSADPVEITAEDHQDMVNTKHETYALGLYDDWLIYNPVPLRRHQMVRYVNLSV